MTTVKVGPFDFKIIEIEKSDDWGFYDPVEMEIAIQSDADTRVKAETVIHEILHAVWDVYKMKKTDGQERIVSLFAIGLSACFRDNKELWESVLRDLS
jgi:Zn-dependent peptidase ImmA (M78 family)